MRVSGIHNACHTIHIPSAARSSNPYCGHCLRRQLRLQHSKQSLIVAAQTLDYKQAGVDIDAGAELVRRIQKLNPSIGGFSGLVPFGEE